MKKLLELILALYAKATLLIHRPKIVGITGSVGKTSTKDAVAFVLSQRLNVRASYGNLNSQLGLPLSVLGFKHPGGTKMNLRSALQWLGIIIVGFYRIFKANYPDILVLEMGTARPGDIQYLVKLVGKLDVAVVTDIGMSHIEFFSSLEALQNEKLTILKGLKPGGLAVLNGDNERVLEGKNQTNAKAVTYGFDPQADFSAEKIKLSIPNTIGKPVIYAGLAAVAVAGYFGINAAEAAKALENFQQPPGRLRLIPGLNNATIVDDTYNAAPSSTISAIDALMSLQSKRKLAAIGQMAELGSMSEQGHREVAAKIAGSKIDMVFLVGAETKIIVNELTKGFGGTVYWFENSEEATPKIKESLAAGDAILVKGSQSARMEKIVKAIMANPSLARQLLVRQSKRWSDT